MSRVKAAVPAAAFATLLVVVGAAAYVAARDEPPPPTPPTTTTRPSREQLVTAIAEGLSEGLDVPLEPTEARCVAAGLVEELGPERVEELEGRPASGLSEDERSLLVRSVVQCVPPNKAAALLATPSTTTTALPPVPGDADL